MSDNAATGGTLVRRRKGDMEELMRQICNKISMGDVPPPRGGNWTVSCIAKAIHQEFPYSGTKPSVGAVADNLRRWHEIGYAVINPKPLSFVDFTDEGRDFGLAALKARAAEARKAQRESVRSAAKTEESEAFEALVNGGEPTLLWEQQEFVFGENEGFGPIAHAPANVTESLSITYTPSV